MNTLKKHRHILLAILLLVLLIEVEIQPTQQQHEAITKTEVALNVHEITITPNERPADLCGVPHLTKGK